MKNLLERIKSGAPQSEKLRKAAQNAIEVAERFADAKAKMTSGNRYTAEGIRGAIQETLPGYAKQLEAARAPINRLKREVARRRDAMVIPTPDPANVSAAIERGEIRTWLRSMEDGKRAAFLAGTNDRRVLEAVLTAPPQLVGVISEPLAETIEARYLDMVHGPEAKAVNELDAVVAEADAIAQVARTKLRSAADMDERAFDNLVGPAERSAKAPWLIKNGNNVTVCEVDENGIANYRAATPAEVENGEFYANVDDWRAAQGQAA